MQTAFWKTFQRLFPSISGTHVQLYNGVLWQMGCLGNSKALKVNFYSLGFFFSIFSNLDFKPDWRFQGKFDHEASLASDSTHKPPHLLSMVT